jgi:hypothetical protein
MLLRAKMKMRNKTALSSVLVFGFLFLPFAFAWVGVKGVKPLARCKLEELVSH